MMETKRITLFAGHYGSGKTNIALNYAIALKEKGLPVCIADLDIVNPYFRTKDSAELLAQKDIRLISSAYANSNVDVPALPQEMYAVTEDKNTFAVLDIGGDDRGALALGRYRPAILEENDYEMLLVINKSRPLTADAQACLEVMREIEAAGGIPFTALVNNTNLGAETTVQTVLDSLAYAQEISRATGLAVKMTTVREDLYEPLKRKVENLMPLKLQKHKAWQ